MTREVHTCTCLDLQLQSTKEIGCLRREDQADDPYAGRHLARFRCVPSSRRLTRTSHAYLDWILIRILERRGFSGNLGLDVHTSISRDRNRAG